MADQYPPKVVTVADIEALLPWAHIELHQVDPYDDESDAELVIYTGLRHVKDDDHNAPLALTEGMLI